MVIDLPSRQICDFSQKRKQNNIRLVARPGVGQLVDDVDRVAHLAQGPVTDDPVTLPRPLNFRGRVGRAGLARQSDVDGTF